MRYLVASMMVSGVCAGFYPVVQSQLPVTPPVVNDVSRYGGDTVPGSMSGANLTYVPVTITQDMIWGPPVAPPRRVVPVVKIRSHHATRHASSEQLARTRAKLERMLRQTNQIGREYNRELARMKGKVSDASDVVNVRPD